jgi:hypothetical protein
MSFFERSRALSAAARVQEHEGAIASRTVPHASGESHSHVQHMTALFALQANWEEIGLTGKSRTQKFYRVNRKLKQCSKR